MMRGRKWIKKALLFELKASFNAFPFFVLQHWAPEGRRSAVAFLCILSLAKQRKNVAVGPPPTYWWSSTLHSKFFDEKSRCASEMTHIW
jgi:hypothetical protein